jgi:hypothetical protein
MNLFWSNCDSMRSRAGMHGGDSAARRRFAHCPPHGGSASASGLISSTPSPFVDRAWGSPFPLMVAVYPIHGRPVNPTRLARGHDPHAPATPLAQFAGAALRAGRSAAGSVSASLGDNRPIWAPEKLGSPSRWPPPGLAAGGTGTGPGMGSGVMKRSRLADRIGSSTELGAAGGELRLEALDDR